MKNLKVITTVFLGLMLFGTQSCSVDEINENSELTTISNESLDSKAPTATVEVTIIIEWHKDVDKEQKIKVRDGYKDEGILIRYEPCPEDVKYEEWTINCEEGLCARQSDTPVDTDDDVKRLYFEISCEDIKK